MAAALPLASIDLTARAREATTFPFTLPLVKQFEKLELKSAVTFCVGKNGSGKSTLLEALGIAIGVPAIGGDDLVRDPTLEAQRALAATLRLAWNKRTHRGFFMRAEDAFNFSHRINATCSELDEIAAGYEQSLSGEALSRARGAVLGQKYAFKARYDGELDARSHGESFLLLFEERIVPNGIYILDEPESPLSIVSVLALIGIIKRAVAQGSQFIIATHSPVLMAFPGATIVSFDAHPLRPVAYDEVEYVQLTRDFLRNPAAFLRHL
jgi:predicted ATPase